jgi:hypothetical protein
MSKIENAARVVIEKLSSAYSSLPQGDLHDALVTVTKTASPGIQAYWEAIENLKAAVEEGEP